MTEHELNQLVGTVRRRADVPRVRSSEIRKIILAMQDISAEQGVSPTSPQST